MKFHGGRYINKDHCGYCKTSDGSSIYGMSVGEMTVEEYQQLCDRGFRRSGSFVYKPDLRASCCPQYTIRLDVNQYKPGKEARQTLNRFNRAVSQPRLKKGGKNNEFDLVRVVDQAERGHLRVVLEPATFTKEKFELFKLYQINVHNEEESEVSEDGFKRFLCTNVFVDGDEVDGAKHQLYYHNDKLIAIGVLDILPRCVSSVYLIWHPDYAQYGMGKVAALREIALCRKLGKPYYYMGFYIHSCVKMRYKGAYQPSYILDPRFPELDDWWVDSKLFFARLDDEKYVSFVAKPEPPRIKYKQGNLPRIGMPGVITRLEKMSIEDIGIQAPGPDGIDFTVTLDDVLDQFRESLANLLTDFASAVGESLAIDSTLDLTS